MKLPISSSSCKKKSPSKIAAMDSPSAIFPSSNLCQFERSRSFFLFLLLSTSTVSYSSHVPKISYSGHCGRMVPEAALTTPSPTVHPVLDLETSHYSGGERVLGRNKSYTGYDYSRTFLTFFATNILTTSFGGLYKIHASLNFTTHHVNHVPHHVNHVPRKPTPDEPCHEWISRLDFFLNGINFSTGISSLNASLGHNGQVEISAEGLYDDRTGYLCVVGCRRLISNDQQESYDCRILVKIQFPSVKSGTSTGCLIMGSIESKWNKRDSLYFERLYISYSNNAAKILDTGS